MTTVPSFWRGVLCAFDLFPTVERRRTGNPLIDDTLAIASDWNSIGRDLENAMKKAVVECGLAIESKGANGHFAETTSYSKPYGRNQ